MKDQEKKNARGETPVLSAEVIRMAREGDQAALTAVYESTHQEVYRTVHALVRSEDLAQDIQQDVYVKAFSHLDQLRDSAGILPWLKKIAVNESRMQLRKKTPVLFSELASEDGEEPDIPDVSVETSPELALDRKETGRLVREILDGLTDGQRLLVGMYYYEQIPLNKISEDLGLNPGTAKSLLARCRKKIEQEVLRLEKKGVKLYGLTPLPFLMALLKNSEPAAKASAKALPAILAESGVGEAVAVHVGRRFFETVLGKAVLAVMTAGFIGGGVAGYHYVKGLNEEMRIKNIHMEVHETDSTFEVGETDTEAEESAEDMIPVMPPTDTNPAENPVPEPEKTEPQPTNPIPANPIPSNSEPEAPNPTEPQPTEPEPTQPHPTEPHPTDPAPTNPDPAENEPSVPEPTTPVGDGSPVPTPVEPEPSTPAAEDTPEDLTPEATEESEPDGSDTPEDLVLPTEPEPEPTQPGDPRIVNIYWKNQPGSDVLRDVPWSAEESICVIAENNAIATLTADNPDMVSIDPVRYPVEIDGLADDQCAYVYKVSASCAGTAHITCWFNGEAVRVLTIENPEYEECVLRTDLDYIWGDWTSDSCVAGTFMRFDILVQGWTAPELRIDNPEILSVYQSFEHTTQSWITKGYIWEVTAQNPGTAHVSAVLNGETVKTWTIIVEPASQTEPITFYSQFDYWQGEEFGNHVISGRTVGNRDYLWVYVQENETPSVYTDRPDVLQIRYVNRNTDNSTRWEIRAVGSGTAQIRIEVDGELADTYTITVE